MITLNNHKDSSCHIKLLILFMALFGLTACDGSNTTMDSRLTVTKQGMGIITSSDNSIDCGGDCTANYNGTRKIGRAHV